MQHETFGQRAADKLAAFAGSWLFLLTFVVLLLGWMIFNAVMAARAFDPYPYILLNLVLSCLSAIQAPILMMSQNRQGDKDRLRAENDFQVNLKTEFIIEDTTRCFCQSRPTNFFLIRGTPVVFLQFAQRKENLAWPHVFKEHNEKRAWNQALLQHCRSMDIYLSKYLISACVPRSPIP